MADEMKVIVKRDQLSGIPHVHHAERQSNSEGKEPEQAKCAAEVSADGKAVSTGRNIRRKIPGFIRGLEKPISHGDYRELAGIMDERINRIITEKAYKK